MHALLLQAIAASCKSLPLDMVDYKATSKCSHQHHPFTKMRWNARTLAAGYCCLLEESAPGYGGIQGHLKVLTPTPPLY